MASFFRRGLLVAALTTALPLGLTAALLAAPAAADDDARTGGGRDADPIVDHPIVIGHRGASGYRPEHTIEAYRVAIRQGADYIEPDLVSTSDGVLVARHENQISGTTDVADRPEFADRRTTKVIDGVEMTGWFTEDFTLAELRTLRATERLPEVRPENTRYDGRYRVPTFAEVIELAQDRGVGIYPETKHPTYFDSIGLSLEEPLLADLRAAGLDSADDEVFIQSFETANLRELDQITELPLIQLMTDTGAPYDVVAAGDDRTYADLRTNRGLRWVAAYADGLGLDKNTVLPRNADGSLTGRPGTVTTRAHRWGLLVHVYTIRAENQFMATDFRIGSDPNAYGRIGAEVQAFLDAGVDGVFADHPGFAVRARDHWAPSN